MLTSLFSLFYVTGECHRFLHRGWALICMSLNENSIYCVVLHSSAPINVKPQGGWVGGGVGSSGQTQGNLTFSWKLESIECVVPENIHAHPMEGWWMGVSKRQFFQWKYDTKMEFPEGVGVQFKKHSMGGVWIIFGTTQCHIPAPRLTCSMGVRFW